MAKLQRLNAELSLLEEEEQSILNAIKKEVESKDGKIGSTPSKTGK